MLHDVTRSLQVGGYSFPNRQDYLARDDRGPSAGQLDAATIVAIQRDWHMRGQNGCVFAMHAARMLGPRQWRHAVYAGELDVETIRRDLADAVEDPANQILSLLFPAATTVASIDALVAAACQIGCYDVTGADDGPGVIQLRYRLGSAESWIVGFAPLDSLPATRRAPFAELAIRTKVKSAVGHPELNGDVTQAHVADVDLSFDKDVMTRLISKTKARTVTILGGQAARSAMVGARAKVTYGLTDGR
jgi:hypothetical protein